MRIGVAGARRHTTRRAAAGAAAAAPTTRTRGAACVPHPDPTAAIVVLAGGARAGGQLAARAQHRGEKLRGGKWQKITGDASSGGGGAACRYGDGGAGGRQCRDRPGGKPMARCRRYYRRRPQASRKRGLVARRAPKRGTRLVGGTGVSGRRRRSRTTQRALCPQGPRSVTTAARPDCAQQYFLHLSAARTRGQVGSEQEQWRRRGHAMSAREMRPRLRTGRATTRTTTGSAEEVARPFMAGEYRARARCARGSSSAVVRMLTHRADSLHIR